MNNVYKPYKPRWESEEFNCQAKLARALKEEITLKRSAVEQTSWLLFHGS